MALEKPDSGYCWHHVPARGELLVTVVGDVHTWWQHWGHGGPRRGGQPVRCLMRERGSCEWCAAGQEARARYVFPGRVAGTYGLVELGRVQYAMLAVVYQEKRWIGARLRLAKEWESKNARISCVFLGREHVSPEEVIDCSDYVRTLGLAAVGVVHPLRVGPPRSGGADAQLQGGPVGDRGR